jgi:hypothetical protein
MIVLQFARQVLEDGQRLVRVAQGRPGNPHEVGRIVRGRDIKVAIPTQSQSYRGLGHHSLLFAPRRTPAGIYLAN